jgi:hypothetical protein
MMLGLVYKIPMRDISGGHGLAFVPTIDPGRETALPCPLYHSGAAGIDINRRIIFIKPLATINYEKRFP